MIMLMNKLIWIKNVGPDLSWPLPIYRQSSSCRQIRIYTFSRTMLSLIYLICMIGPCGGWMNADTSEKILYSTVQKPSHIHGFSFVGWPIPLSEQYAERPFYHAGG